MPETGHLWRWRFDSWGPNEWDYVVTADKRIDDAVERLRPVQHVGKREGSSFAVHCIEYMGTVSLKGLKL